jgi:hypothetical protein
VDLLINDQTVPKIMGKMPIADLKKWATGRPEWAREDMGAAFEKYVERTVGEVIPGRGPQRTRLEGQGRSPPRLLGQPMS